MTGRISKLSTKGGAVSIHRLDSTGHGRIPYSIKILLESALRHLDGKIVTDEHVQGLAKWNARDPGSSEVPFFPGRVLLQDFTGVPCVVDLSAMRSAVERLGGDPKKINPRVPCDLVIDHSVQVDRFGSEEALRYNAQREFERNQERYKLLHWSQNVFENFRVVPPATGIVHQVNLEYLAKGVLVRDGTAFPDSLVGTDSHTTMINGLGVAGWGVGGIEAEAVMLGLPVGLLMPRVVGVSLKGALKEGTTATDLVLTIVEMLRRHGVVGKFVEFTGPALDHLSVPDRATIANMGPEYGATVGLFPVDDETLRYLKFSGRDEEEVDLVERYFKEQGLWRSSEEPELTERLELDISTVEPSLAGPKRPQDRIALSKMKQAFTASLTAPVKQRGFGLGEGDLGRNAPVNGDTLRHGSVVIAAITSCTNTSNPSVMLAAGLVARKAVEKGLKVPSYVKTSLAPGSQVVTEYLKASGLQESLDALGFQTVGYGCTTCIGNSGPLPEAVADAVKKNDLVVSAVLSGNRNFEGRVSPLTRANYLASPPLVVAYALAGTTDIDFEREPLSGDVYLRDIWPTNAEVSDTLRSAMTPEMYRSRYAEVWAGPPEWQAIEGSGGDLYTWDDSSTYIREVPFFDGFKHEPDPPRPITGARVLALAGDSVTTDHISPAGAIPADGPAGKYLQTRGVNPGDFNSFGSRRGNHEVMMRGTFANIRFRNQLAPGTEGGWTTYLPTGEQMTIFEASEKYFEAGIPLIVIGGKEYGTGSSRDWAAKGTLLLGARAVIVESFERIHRSNLIGMGVLPLQFVERPELTGKETFEIPMPSKPGETLTVRADGREFKVLCRIDTPIELDYFNHGGILPYVLRKLI